MIAVPSVKVVSFLDWLANRVDTGLTPHSLEEALFSLASEYLEAGIRPHYVSLPLLIKGFQLTPDLARVDPDQQMVDYVTNPAHAAFLEAHYADLQWTGRLHRHLEAYRRFLRDSRWEITLQSFLQEHHHELETQAIPPSGWLRTRLVAISDQLTRSYADYRWSPHFDEQREAEFVWYQRRKAMESKLTRFPLPELGRAETADRLAKAAQEHLQSGRPSNKAGGTLAFLITMVTGDRTSSQAVEFLSWLETTYPDLQLTAGFPKDELNSVVAEFCEQKGFSNPKSFSDEVRRWLLGKPARFDLKHFFSIRQFSRFKKIIPDESPLSRYRRVPFHGLFLFESHNEFPRFLDRFARDLHALTGDWLDLYHSEVDYEDAIPGHEIIHQIRSIRINPTSVPGLLLWTKSLADGHVIPFRDLQHAQIHELMKVITAAIAERADQAYVLQSATTFIERTVSVAHRPSFVIERVDFVRNKYDIDLKDNHGNVQIGDNNKMNIGMDAADVFGRLEQAIRSSGLPSQEQEAQLHQVHRMAEEVKRDKPDRTFLNVMGQGLVNTLKHVPEIVTAVQAVMDFVNKA